MNPALPHSIPPGDLGASLQAILHQSVGGVLQADLDGRVALANQRLHEMLGYDDGRLAGLSLLEITHAEDREALRSHLEALRRDSADFVLEQRLVRRDGSALWTVLNVAAVRDAGGRARSTFAIAIDVTSRKTAERRAAFLADLSRRLAVLRAERDIVACAVDMVGRYLGAHRCYFVECLESENRVVVSRNWVRDEAPSLEGTLSLFDFGGLEWWRHYAGGDFSVTDVAAHPLTHAKAQAYIAVGIASYAVQPFKRDGAWTVVLGVTENRPREWTADEMGLLEDVVARVWPLVERARADLAVARLTLESESMRRLYETVVSNTPDLVYVFDLDHRFTYANPALLRMWGRTAAESMGRNCLELGYPAWHAEMHDRELDQAIATRRPVRGEVEFTGTEGRRIYDYIFAPVIGADGKVEAVAGTTRDVTERKQWEAVLASQASTLELVVSGAPLVDVLQALCGMVGRHATEPLYASLLLMQEDGVHLRPAADSGLPESWTRSLDPLPIGPGVGACGTAAHFGREVIAEDIARDPRWADFKDRALSHGLRSCWSTPILSSEGRVLGTFAVYHSAPHVPGDGERRLVQIVTRIAGIAIERKRFEEDLAHQAQALREADRRKDQFIALLAHELRNPLAPLRTGLEVLRLADGDAARAHKTRSVMERQLAHMVRLVDDLLDVSRITNDKMELRRSAVNLADVVANAVETARPAIESAGHDFRVSLPAQAVTLYADLTRLAQVISNLLTNSAKYTPRGGRIDLAARVEAGQVAITVRDDGAGIPPTALATIFEMFSQVDRQLERMTGGLGIGLALVKGLTEMHGGCVEAHSEGEGRGSTFTVRLPLLDAPASSPGPSDAQPPRASFTRRKVLVVDDNRDAAASLAMMLEILGNDVRIAYDGIEAVDESARFEPDLVLMDLGMPRLDGHEAARRIRRQAHGARAKIIALTGWGQEADRVRSRAAGCDGHLVKPVSAADLEALLERLDRPDTATTSAPAEPVL